MLLRTIVEALGKQRRRGGRRRKKSPREASPPDEKTSMPLAYALARSWAWPALKFRCETHPLEVSEIAMDARGETILHWTCLGKPPLDTVQAILAVCPDMARVRNKSGHLPLHVAISYRAAPEIVRALLDVFPESGGIANGVGAYPLHLLCDYGSSVDSLCAVLEGAAGAATIRKALGQSPPLTPLQILNSRMNFSVFRRAIQSMQEARKRQQETRERQRQQSQQQVSDTSTPQIPGSEGYPADSPHPQPQLRNSRRPSNENSNAVDRNERMIASFQQNDYWQKAALLVLVDYTKQPITPMGLEDDRANLVHACAGIPDCPRFLLQFAILLHMDDLTHTKDELGRLPLHVAAKNHAATLAEAPSKTHLRHQKSSEKTLEMILEACPVAARVQDAEDNLPLGVALEEIRQQTKIKTSRFWSVGLQHLLDANLAALETLNLEEGLYPYVWAQRMTSVDMLFQSARRHPNLFDQGRDEGRLNHIVGC